jgi:hypothetical protein
VRQHQLRQEQASLQQSSPERQALLRITAELERVRSAIGLDQELVHLNALLRRQGHRSCRSGATFEELALTVTQCSLLPRLLRRGNTDTPPADLRVLRHVTLGAARLELDQVVIRQPGHSGQAVAVLAVIEVKRNINELSRGLRLRRENLAWLTRQSQHYDAQMYRTNYFRAGHFDRAAVHQQDGESFVFEPGSFCRFTVGPTGESTAVPLYFITRAGSVYGLSATALARVHYRLATDTDWDPMDDGSVEKLLDWCRALAEPVETPDVLQSYAGSPRGARRILIVGR